MSYLADPGGRFASDTHRRVLAHLSLPEDNYGWSEPALLERMRPDVGTNLQTAEELQQVLADLEKEGQAQRFEGDVWKMSQEGLDVLTGSIANEPTLEDAKGGITPATIGSGISGATRLQGEGPPGVDPQDVNPDTEEAPSAPSGDVVAPAQSSGIQGGQST